MKGLVLVVAFWAGVSSVVAWALGVAAAIDAGWYPVAGFLIGFAFVGLSAFMWIVFSELER